MMTITESKAHAVLIAAFLWLAIGTQFAQAQTSRNEVLDEVVIVDRSECAVIRVKFNLPVKYKNHFPETAGKELRVYLAPVAVTAEERQQVVRSEYFSPPDSDIVEIAEIIYEGRDVVEPYLTLLFAHPMKFSVKQGDDFRSVIISVYLPEAKNGCMP
ncbi:MAG: hypothetical protein KKG47_00545 [Proteobacteria bacterium]|nr:hypothetical protein [Pseudomonadota bacterium]MBU1737227.1 hypothetical protein [Pseudomonadota bacterium]